MNSFSRCLSVQNLCVEMDDFFILNNISFEVEASQLLHIKGRNGAGKTTLLRTLSGLMPINAGTISYGAGVVKTDIGYVGHKVAIEGNLNVEENIRASLLCEQPIMDLEQMLTLLHLKTHRFHFSDQLSQGQKKRITLARFFSLKRKLWLLDEPFTALDIKFQHFLKQAITQFVKEGGCVVLTSHLDIEFDDIHFIELAL